MKFFLNTQVLLYAFHIRKDIIDKIKKEDFLTTKIICQMAINEYCTKSNTTDGTALCLSEYIDNYITIVKGTENTLNIPMILQ